MIARTYPFSTFCAWGLTASCAALGLVGVLGMFTPDGELFGLDRVGWCVTAFAFVMAFAILQINNMAEAAMHAIDRPFAQWHWPTLIPAIICGVGFAVGANIGVHLGWEILRGGAAHPELLPETGTIDAIFLFLSIAKPLSMLAVAGRRAIDQAEARAREALELAGLTAEREAERANRHQERLAEIQARFAVAGEPAKSEPARPVPRGSRPKLVDAMAKTAAGAAAGPALMGAGEPAQAAPQAAQPEPRREATEAPGEPTPAQRAEARSLIAQGVAPKEVSRRTGVPHGTCKRQAAEFKAGRWAA